MPLFWGALLGLLGKIGTVAKVGGAAAKAGTAAQAVTPLAPPAALPSQVSAPIQTGGPQLVGPQTALAPPRPTGAVAQHAQPAPVAGYGASARPQPPAAVPRGYTSERFGASDGPDMAPERPSWSERMWLGNKYAEGLAPEARGRASTTGWLNFGKGMMEGRPFKGILQGREGAREVGEASVDAARGTRWTGYLDKQLSKEGLGDTRRTELEAMRAREVSYVRPKREQTQWQPKEGSPGKEEHRTYDADLQEWQTTPGVESRDRWKEPTRELTEPQRTVNRSRMAARDWLRENGTGKSSYQLKILDKGQYERSQLSLYGEDPGDFSDWNTEKRGLFGKKKPDTEFQMSDDEAEFRRRHEIGGGG